MTIHLDDLPGEWVKQAACNIDSAEEFFRGTDSSTPRTEPSAKYAKAICAGCDVRDACLAWVLADDEKRLARKEALNDGVWGGTTKLERHKLRKR